MIAYPRWRWVLAAAAVFYLLLLPRYEVGYYSDDALYILAAQSLAGGHYQALYHPSHRALNDPLPGYPLFLAPFVRLLQPHWSWLKIVSLLLTLASCVLMWKLFDPWLPEGLRTLVLALFAFNPTPANFSSSVLSEPCFLFFTLLIFLLLRKLLNHPRSGQAWLLGLLLGWAALVRPQGIVLIASVGISLGFSRRWRLLGQTLGISLGLWAAVMLRNYWMTQSATGYLHHWQTSLPFLTASYGDFFTQWVVVIKTLCLEALLALNIESANRWVVIGQGVVSAGVLVFLGAGFYRLSLWKNRSQGLLLAITLYLFFYTWVHTLWWVNSPTPRYFLPLLPYLLFFLVEGARFFWERFGIPQAGKVLLLAGLSISYGYQDLFALQQACLPDRQARGPSAAGRLPRATFEWIQKGIPTDSYILTVLAPTVYLYTNRHARAFLLAKDVEELRYRLLNDGLTHVLVIPSDVLFVRTSSDKDPGTVWKRAGGWIAAWPEAFPPLYQNSAESAVLYAVKLDPRYQKAYKSYLSALDHAQSFAWEAALAELQQALTEYPRLFGALNAYGTTALLAGHPLPEAETRLKEALRLRPQHPLASLNLARVYHKMGKAALARQYYQESLEAAQRMKEWARLVPVIERERSSM